MLSHPSSPSTWTGEKGFVSKAILENPNTHFPKASTDVLVLVCGPPGMMSAVSGDKTKDYKQGEVTGLLKELAFNQDMVYKF